MEEQLIVLSKRTPFAPKNGHKSWKAMWKKKSKGERVFLWIMFAIFCIYGLSLVYPIVWSIINSFKTKDDFGTNAFTLPSTWTFASYQRLFDLLRTQKNSIFISIWDSIWMSTVSTILGLIASCLTSYVVAKYRFKLSGLIYSVAILIQVIPLVGSAAGMYNLIRNVYYMAENPWKIWPIWFGGFGFSFLILYSSFKTVSWSYAESAFIDGASHFTTFVRIMLPQVKPVLASLFLVNFIGAWNDYMTAHLYMSPSYKPLALAVYELMSQAERVGTPAFLGVVTIAIIPPLILFICFQKIIMENTTAGGLKG